MRFLVTGGNGFIGLRTIKKLLERGQEAVIMSRSPKIADPELKDKVEVISGDIRLLSDVMKAVNYSRPDGIIHVAYALTAAGEADPYWGVQVNVTGTNNIYEAARLFGVRRVLFCSSIAAYAPPELYGDREVTEDEDLLKSSSIYGQTKSINEFMASKFEAKYGVEIPSLRISAVYGTGREDRGVTAWTSKLVAGAIAKKPVEIGIRPDQKASFIYVDDTAEQLVRLALKKNLEHRIYNTGGITATPTDFANIVKKYYPEAEISFSPDAVQWPYPPKVNGSRLENEIGFAVRSIEEGLIEQITLELHSQGLKPLEK
jgi:nucleoside-diphosphate-sugar epimerase